MWGQQKRRMPPPSLVELSVHSSSQSSEDKLLKIFAERFDILP